MSSSGGVSTICAVKLNDHNYRAWADCVRMVLRGVGLLHHLTNNPPPDPVPDSEKKNVIAWRTVDDRVQSIFAANIELDIRLDVLDFQTSQEIWDYLTERFAQSSTALRVSLIQQLYGIEQGDSTVG